MLEKLLPTGELECLGAKYVQVAMNFFRNDYLRDVIHARPEYNQYLRAYAGDDDIRTAKIDPVPRDFLREEEHDLNSIFGKQVQARAFYETVKAGGAEIPAEHANDPVMVAYWAYYGTSGHPVNISLIHFWNNI